jgi:hypothetical protein
MTCAEPIRHKAQMYRLLASGAFGNTIPQFFDVHLWAVSPEALAFDLWGVRTMTPGGPCRLNCPYAEVAETAYRFIREGHRVNISPMVDAVARVTLWADVYDSESGLIVYGIENPPRGGSWRALMPSQGREWRGIEARRVLARHLNPSSLADLWAVFDRWPGHVVELSALAGTFGTVPGRNAVVWEVRAADGSYEKWGCGR